MKIKLLANENIPLISSKYLEKCGYDIVHIGSVDPSITDEEVMTLAIKESRLIITFDRDYGNLVFRDGYRPLGVIYLRLTDSSPNDPGEFVHSLLQSDRFTF
ncbi:MAG: DUF5615 family PIN-like protein [Bacteroidia bacterium]